MLIISLGGSLIVPNTIDVDFVRNFQKAIAKHAKKHGGIIIICGGGSTARKYQAAFRAVKSGVFRNALDEVGIAATRLNALFIQQVFGALADKKIIEDPTKKHVSKKRILIGCGWKPGFSTDMDAVLAAKTYGADTVVNLSDISHIYDSDPKKNPKAKPVQRMEWKDLRKIVGNKWSPGAHLPFDPVAAKEGEKLGLRLVFLTGRNMKNFEKFLKGEKFVGTSVYKNSYIKQKK